MPPLPTITRLRGRKLQALRQRYFHHHPLCVVCEAKGRVRPAVELDHITPLYKGGTDTEDNRQGLCHACHEAKTAQDMGYTLHPTIGLDGWPVLSKERIEFFPDWLPVPTCQVMLVCGPPASGKTTLVQSRVATDDIVIDLDVIISELSQQPIYSGTTPWLGKGILERNKRLAALAHELPTRVAWVIATAARFRRTWWQAKLHPVETFVLHTPAEECIARIKMDTRRRERFLEQIEAVREWWAEEALECMGIGQELRSSKLQVV